MYDIPSNSIIENRREEGKLSQIELQIFDGNDTIGIREVEFFRALKRSSHRQLIFIFLPLRFSLSFNQTFCAS